MAAAFAGGRCALERSEEMKMRNTVLLAGLGVLLAACGGRDALKGEFLENVRRYGENHGVCLPLALNVSEQGVQDGRLSGRRIMLGMDRIVLETESADGRALNEAAVKQMAILTDEGFYRKESGRHDRELVFSLTEKGRGQTRGGSFCIGKQKVENVLYYTEPAISAQGLKVSRVVYESDVVLEAWAKRLLDRGSADWKDRLQTRRVEQATMVKTNDGWRDMRELPQPDLPFPE